MNDDLKPCPLCRADVEVQSSERPDDGSIFCFFIECSCGLRLIRHCPMSYLEKEILANLIEAWNNRVG